MAVQSDTSSISYTGNNSTSTSYAVPFVFLENSHLSAFSKVTATGVETLVTLTNHTGAGDVNGGTVRTAVAVPATSTLTIFRTVPATQTTTYQEGGDFPASSHERALDKLTFLAQQNKRAADRSFRVTEGSGVKNEVVAVPNTLLGLDAANQPKALTVDQVKSLLSITGVTLDVDAGMKTFADAGERALAVPDFTGQLGTQRDTNDIYISAGTAAGNWSLVDENMSLADFSSGFFTADATGRGKFGSGFVDNALIADSSSTTTGVTNAKFRHSAALSVIGRSSATIGAPADIAAVNDGEVFRRDGASVGFGQVATAGLANASVTLAKLGTNEQKQVCRAWVNFDGTTASPSTIRSSYNVSSVTKSGTGSYAVNFATALTDANYASMGTSRTSGGAARWICFVTPTSTNACSVIVADPAVASYDSSNVSVAIFGN